MTYIAEKKQIALIAYFQTLINDKYIPTTGGLFSPLSIDGVVGPVTEYFLTHLGVNEVNPEDISKIPRNINSSQGSVLLINWANMILGRLWNPDSTHHDKLKTIEDAVNKVSNSRAILQGPHYPDATLFVDHENYLCAESNIDAILTVFKIYLRNNPEKAEQILEDMGKIIL